MTEVVILHRIPGHEAGEITELTPRLEQHVLAGNARIIPAPHDAWSGEEAQLPPQASPLQLVTSQDVAASDDHGDPED